MSNEVFAVSITQLDMGALYVHRFIDGFAGVLVAPAGQRAPQSILLTRTPDHAKQLYSHCVEFTPDEWQRVEGGAKCQS